MVALMAIGGDGICTKTFGKSERAYQGGRLDKPHKFPGNVGRMTSSRRSSRGVDTQDLGKHSRRTNTNALTQLLWIIIPALFHCLLRSCLRPGWRAKRKRTFLCMHGTQQDRENFLQRDIDTVLSVLLCGWPWDVVAGIPKGILFYTQSIESITREWQGGPHSSTTMSLTVTILTDPWK